MVNRGEVWWADLPEPAASEPGYRRPVIIIQADEFTLSRLNTVVVVGLTSNLNFARAPGNVHLAGSKTGLRQDSVANVSQIVTIDKRFLLEKVGELEHGVMQQLCEGVGLVLGL